MGIFKLKFGPLCITIIFLAAMVLFSTTPIIWERAGRQSETYPELFFLLFGVPLALWLWAASVFVAIKGYRILNFRLLHWLPYRCGVIIGLLSIGLVWAWLASKIEIAGTLAFLADWIALIVITVGGVWVMWKEPK